MKELSADGIITVSADRVRHSCFGNYKSATKQYPTARMTAGGHTSSALRECRRLGIKYEITGEFSNGVRIGNVPSSATKIKRNANAQAWFPKDWTADDIVVAGTYVANKSIDTSNVRFATYRGVRVGVYIDMSTNCIDTIFPDNTKQPWKGKWEVPN